MASETKVQTFPERKELYAERLFDAPPELVFKAFTEPERLAQWWGPRGWTLPVCNLDLRVGGSWHYMMKGPDGTESWGMGTYKEIDPPNRLVWRDVFSDKDGNEAPGMPGMEITAEFRNEGGKTRLVSRAVFESAEALQAVMDMGIVAGMTETWDRLEEYLAA